MASDGSNNNWPPGATIRGGLVKYPDGAGGWLTWNPPPKPPPPPPKKTAPAAKARAIAAPTSRPTFTTQAAADVYPLKGAGDASDEIRIQGGSITFDPPPEPK